MGPHSVSSQPTHLITTNNLLGPSGGNAHTHKMVLANTYTGIYIHIYKPRGQLYTLSVCRFVCAPQSQYQTAAMVRARVYQASHNVTLRLNFITNTIVLLSRIRFFFTLWVDTSRPTPYNVSFRLSSVIWFFWGFGRESQFDGDVVQIFFFLLFSILSLLRGGN